MPDIKKKDTSQLRSQLYEPKSDAEMRADPLKQVRSRFTQMEANTAPSLQLSMKS